ncbi:fibrillin-1-like isoform X2 [Artemia franciscana]|uniref:fibrillin-1-like isoform X2 n=1 Tax=Artemia franciscana TaxID=6661 RepID=UPI0032DA649F
MDKRSTVLFWAIYCFLIAYADEQSDVCEDFGCDQQCEVVEGQAVCSCYKGFQLDNDGKTCSDINECLEETSGCTYECVNTLGSYKCLCPDGSTVHPKKKEGCSIQEEMLTSKFPKDVHKRRGRTQPSFITQNQMNIRRTKHYFPKHQHLSQVSVEQSSRGAAPKLKITRKQTFEEKYEDVVDISIPLSPHLSLDSTMRLTNFVQSALDEEEKKDRGCTHASCQCHVGYRLATDGKTCIDLNECMNGQANCNPGKCMNTIGSARCICPEGYQYTEGLTCEDIDECKLPDLPCSQKCINLPGAFRCDCQSGFALSSDGMTCDLKNKSEVRNSTSSGDQPLKISVKSLKTINGTKQSTNHFYDKEDPFVHESLKWLQLFSGLYSGMEKKKKEEGDRERQREERKGSRKHCHCHNNGVCVGGKCICSPGFQGKRCQHDIDECHEAPCEQLCRNLPGSFECDCGEGFILNSDNSTCSRDQQQDFESSRNKDDTVKHAKECEVPCLNDGTCEGGTCSCPDVYSGKQCEHLDLIPSETEPSPLDAPEEKNLESGDLAAFSTPVVYKLLPEANKLELLNLLSEELTEKEKKEKHKKDRLGEENEVMRDTPFIEEEEDPNSVAHPSEAFYFNPEFVTSRQSTTTMRGVMLQSNGDNKTCFFLGRQIASGKKFFRDEGNCTRCLCKDGEIRCQPRQCSRSDCTNPIIGQCCDYCPEDCVVDHQVYRNGMAFISELDPCRTCTCMEGRVICDDIRCPPLDCEAQYRVLPADSCCPECFVPEPGCFHRSRFYYKGQLWVDHAKCQTCLCKDDNDVKCNQRVCLAECTNPVFVTGDCCPRCDQGCQVGTAIYLEGESFLDKENPCTNCRCHGGNITCTSKDCPEKCHYRGKTLQIGEIFHWDEDPCTECTCAEGAKTVCKTLECDTKCLHGVLFHGRCCPLCDSCDYLGILRSNGEQFLSEEGGIQFQCHCKNGTVNCIK